VTGHIKESRTHMTSAPDDGELHNIVRQHKRENWAQILFHSKLAIYICAVTILKARRVYFVCISHEQGAVGCLMYFSCFRRLHRPGGLVILISQGRSISCRYASHT
jgi:hypothetical protein